MKAINKKVMTALSLLLISTALFSFTSYPGGEGFEIYLGKKLVLQSFGGQMNNVKSLQLDQRFSNDQLIIKYHHCGRVGKNRIITLKNDQNKILKEWSFSDDTKTSAIMSCNVKDILGLKKGKTNQTINLYYTSSELPKGRHLASLVLSQQNIAMLVD